MKQVVVSYVNYSSVQLKDICKDILNNDCVIFNSSNNFKGIKNFIDIVIACRDLRELLKLNEDDCELIAITPTSDFTTCLELHNIKNITL